MKLKKLLLSLTSIALLLAMTGAGALAESKLPSDSESAPVYEAGNVPAQADLKDAILPPIHALVVTMVENDLTYDAEDPLFQWTSLYYMLSLYGQMDERAELTDDTMIVPSEMVLDYAAPLFPDLTVLPQLPEELSDRVSYDAKTDTYSLARGDEGLIQIQLTSNYPVGLSDRRITGELIYLETGESLCSFQVQLTQVDTMIGYTISNLVIL